MSWIVNDKLKGNVVAIDGHEVWLLPGCRMPSFDIDGRPILDLLGAAYTLIRFDTSIDMSPLVEAATAAGLPLTVIDAVRPDDESFTTSLTVTRFDQHVAWRGDTVPDNVSDLIATFSGARSAAEHAGI